jgi:excisionase family DNA binding protein
LEINRIGFSLSKNYLLMEMNMKKTESFSDIFQPTDLLSRKQAAAYLGVTVRTLAVWACVKRYNLPYVKMGRLVKYRRSALDSFIELRTVHQGEE